MLFYSLQERKIFGLDYVIFTRSSWYLFGVYFWHTLFCRKIKGLWPKSEELIDATARDPPVGHKLGDLLFYGRAKERSHDFIRDRFTLKECHTVLSEKIIFESFFVPMRDVRNFRRSQVPSQRIRPKQESRGSRTFDEKGIYTRSLHFFRFRFVLRSR